MATETKIKAGIEKLVNSYSLWTIGLTDDPNTLEGNPSSPAGWHLWDADSDEVARNVEQHFVGKGMESSSGGFRGAEYVYIFLGIN